MELYGGGLCAGLDVIKFVWGLGTDLVRRGDLFVAVGRQFGGGPFFGFWDDHDGSTSKGVSQTSVEMRRDLECEECMAAAKDRFVLPPIS
jgi:hypothetical protein